MKRKLNENDVPETISARNDVGSNSGFDCLELDPRILRGLLKQKWSTPTSVQSKAIPLALEGKDCLVRSGTGSGKTAAYVLPILENTLRRKSQAKQSTTTLILVPTKELAGQVTKLLGSFCTFLDGVRVQNITGKEADVVQRARLADLPDIVVATPSRAAANLNKGHLNLKDLAHLVIDEADLVMSYGFQEDLETCQRYIPKGVQTFLLSATLSTEVDKMKGLFCRDPVIIALDDEEKSSKHLHQYVLKCAEDVKFYTLAIIFLLKLIKGKTIIFVADVDRSYRVKLFLEQVGIKSCVLNSELPLASRLHVVEEFNKSIYDILIASDENEVLGMEGLRRKRSKKIAEQDDAEEPKDSVADEALADAASANSQSVETPEQPEPPKKKRKHSKRDQDSGVGRGIDFKNVSCVLNFDLPLTYKQYFHRIGRTARAGQSGTSISFVVPKALYRKHKPTSHESCENNEEVLAKIIKHQKDEIKPWNLDQSRLEPFRYRLADALRSVTRIAIREARIRELRQEILKSQKLSRYFAENPSDLAHLRHDGELRSARVQPHLKHVPDYLLPGGSKKAMAEDVGFVGLQKDERQGNKIRRNRAFNKARGKGKKVVLGRNGKVDPLKTFNARGRGKK